jgi:hypothetical protein
MSHYKRCHFIDKMVEVNTCVHWKNYLSLKLKKQQEEIITYVLMQLHLGRTTMALEENPIWNDVIIC